MRVGEEGLSWAFSVKVGHLKDRLQHLWEGVESNVDGLLSNREEEHRWRHHPLVHHHWTCAEVLPTSQIEARWVTVEELEQRALKIPCCEAWMSAMDECKDILKAKIFWRRSPSPSESRTSLLPTVRDFLHLPPKQSVCFREKAPNSNNGKTKRKHISFLETLKTLPALKVRNVKSWHL